MSGLSFVQRLKKRRLESRSCSEEMARAARDQPGIAQALYDPQEARLELAYDAERISEADARRVTDKIQDALSERMPTCSLREEGGLCEDCLSVADAGRKWPAKGGDLQAQFDQGRLSVKREGTTSTAMLTRKIKAEDAEAKRRRFRATVEPILAALTLLFLIIGRWHPEAILAAYLTGAYYGVLDGWQTLKHRRLDVNFLMIAAALGAATVGEAPEGATLLFLFSTSNALQNYALGRSRRAIRSLMALKPETATLLIDGKQQTVSVDSLKPDDRVLVRPGERFPADGRVESGRSHADQSAMTGESTPVAKGPGDPVYAGTVNASGALEVLVERAPEETLLAKILALVEHAQEQKAKSQLWLEKFEQRYALIVIGGAIATIFALLPFGYDWDQAFYRGMTLLVVASPCALVIGAPATLLSALAAAARRGALIKGGEPLERLAEIQIVAFDKTGTLTEGRLKVAETALIEGKESELWQIVADLESRSEHPIAKALLSGATERGYAPREITDPTAVVGKGIIAKVDGSEIRAGSARFAQEATGRDAPEQIAALLAKGNTTVVVTQDDRWIGAIAVADVPRPSAVAAVQALHQMGIKTAILSGDAQPIAERLAQQLGIDSFEAELLPDQKLVALERLSKQYGSIAMVGDGVNDAPALAAADVGIAMGAGSDAALESADAALISNDLRHLPILLHLARKSMALVRQNLYFAVGVIVVLVGLVFTVGLRMPLGVVGHEGSTILVVLNGLRMLIYRPPEGLKLHGAKEIEG